MTGTSSAITARLADYAAGALARPLPEAVAERTRLHLLDTIAAIVSGSRLAAGIAARRYVERSSQAGEACAPGTMLMLGAVNAALVNGMAAHADETDDTHAASLTHPGSVVIPAALAVAERTGADGEAMLRSIALGYDVCCRIGIALGAEAFFALGFDTHAFGGVFGAVAAAGALAGLDGTQFRFALSYAAQQCAGLTTWRRDGDHVEKAFDFAGMPARNGVEAALMVASGMTGVIDVFDGEPGFFAAFGATAQPDLLLDGLGERFEIAATSIKKWCVATPAQASLDALDHILRTHRISGDTVAQVIAEIPAIGARVVTGDMPAVNAAHLLALLLVDGTLGFASSHDQARMRDPAVLAARKRITIIPTERLGRSRESVVRVETRDGRAFVHHAQHVRGTPANAMGRGEIIDKALDLVAPVIGMPRAQQLIDTILTIETVPDIRLLRPLLQFRD